jgi:hypothetical protein
VTTAVKQHTFNGWADADTLTTGGTGSGDVLSKVSAGASSTLTARTASAVNGVRGGRAAVTSSNVACYVGLAFNAGAVTTATVVQSEFIIPVGGYGTTVILLRGMDTTDVTQRWRVSINSTGNLLFVNSANIVQGTSSGTYNSSTIRVKVTAEGTTSAAWSVKIYTTPNSSTPAETMSNTGANLGGVIQYARVGVAAASGTSITVDFDDFGVSDGDDLGPAALAPNGIAATASLGSLAIAQALAITPSGIAAAASLGALADAQALSVAPTGIAATASLGTPAVSQALTVAPTGIAAVLTPGALAIAQPLTIVPAGIGATATLGTPDVGQSLAIAPASLTLTATPGTPTVADGAMAVRPAGIAATIVLGSPQLAEVDSHSPIPGTLTATTTGPRLTPGTTGAGLTASATQSTLEAA